MMEKGPMKKEDKIVPIFIRDGIAYPIALDAEQESIFEITMTLLGKITIVHDAPLGKAITLKEMRDQKYGTNAVDTEVESKTD